MVTATAQKTTTNPRPRRRGKGTKGAKAQTLAERRKLGRGFTPDQLQQAMHLVHRLAGLPDPTPEYKFAWADMRRKWAIDYAWPEARIALEVEGHGHQKDNRYHTDIEKYNELAAHGWLLIRATYDMLPTPDLRRDSAVLPLLQRAFAYRCGQAA